MPNIEILYQNVYIRNNSILEIRPYMSDIFKKFLIRLIKYIQKNIEVGREKECKIFGFLKYADIEKIMAFFNLKFS